MDLTGAWGCDDDGTYYVRQLGNLVTWAGLHRSGFHMGVEFTNVFQGLIQSDGVTLRGNWVDVPRGGTNSAGNLGLHIAGTDTIELIAGEVTGGFGGTTWNKTPTSLEPQDIAAVAGLVQRYEGSLAGNNPPCRDFSVLWGTVGAVTGPSYPPSPDNYCSFVGWTWVDDVWSWLGFKEWGGDGDFDFDITPDFSRFEPDFWTAGWLDREFIFQDPSNRIVVLPANDYMLYLYDRFQRFHCEAIMYGRQNDKDHCSDAPVILLPAWRENGGNSVLVNGYPINGNVSAFDNGLQFVPNPNEKLSFEILGGTVVRVTGVLADDHGHEDQQAPEIHPIYAIDIVQDFSQPRAEFSNLTGAWHADDVGTYYLRQTGSDLWWLGISRDQGRRFANVFKGTVSGNRVEGSWVDVPMGVGGILGRGDLVLYASAEGLSSRLVKNSEIGGFGATIWTKLYDTPASLPDRPGLPAV